MIEAKETTILRDLSSELSELFSSKLKTLMYIFDSNTSHHLILHVLATSCYHFLNKHGADAEKSVDIFCELLKDLHNYVSADDNEEKQLN